MAVVVCPNPQNASSNNSIPTYCRYGCCDSGDMQRPWECCSGPPAPAVRIETSGCIIALIVVLLLLLLAVVGLVAYCIGRRRKKREENFVPYQPNPVHPPQAETETQTQVGADPDSGSDIVPPKQSFYMSPSQEEQYRHMWRNYYAALQQQRVLSDTNQRTASEGRGDRTDAIKNDEIVF